MNANQIAWNIITHLSQFRRSWSYETSRNHKAKNPGNEQRTKKNISMPVHAYPFKIASASALVVILHLRHSPYKAPSQAQTRTPIQERSGTKLRILQVSSYFPLQNHLGFGAEFLSKLGA